MKMGTAPTPADIAKEWGYGRPGAHPDVRALVRSIGNAHKVSFMRLQSENLQLAARHHAMWKACEEVEARIVQMATDAPVMPEPTLGVALRTIVSKCTPRFMHRAYWARPKEPEGLEHVRRA
jgi:hypothetical protein